MRVEQTSPELRRVRQCIEWWRCSLPVSYRLVHPVCVGSQSRQR